MLHLLEAVRAGAAAPRIIAVGSADEYGLVRPDEVPLREDAPLRPASPYAVSKVAQGYLALQYALSPGLHVVRTRTFHHTGPRRGEQFAESSFARQLAEIEAGQRPPRLEVGNLEVMRDFTDVRDVVRAYWMLLDRGVPGEVYNVCSGRGVRLDELLERLIALSGRRVEVHVDASRLRSATPAACAPPPGGSRASRSSARSPTSSTTGASGSACAPPPPPNWLFNAERAKARRGTRRVKNEHEPLLPAERDSFARRNGGQRVSDAAPPFSLTFSAFLCGLCVRKQWN